MKKRIVKSGLSVICLLTGGLCMNQSFADWSNNPSQRNYNQGYGDFPPASTDRQPRHNWSRENRQVERSARDYRESNPWSSDDRPVPPPAPNYTVPKHSVPVYRAYDQARSDRSIGRKEPSSSGPWSNRESTSEGPWNDKGSSFSPWGRRGGWGSNSDPFANRGPRGWASPDKHSISKNWDDMLNSPSRIGNAPGGWSAPSVSAPNPVDIGDEFNDAARDLPYQMDNFQWDDNRRRYR